MNKNKVYDIIFWVSMLVIVVWIILKMIGVINSPVWMQMIPYMSIVFAAGAFYQSINAMKADIADLKVRMCIVEKDIIQMQSGIKHFDSDLHSLKLKLS